MRYEVTLVLEAGTGKVPHGADVLGLMSVSRHATHRFSYCDGHTLTVIVDWSARSAEQAGDDALLATRLMWAQLTGADPGEPLVRRVRPLRLARVAAGVRAPLDLIGDLPLDDVIGKPGAPWRSRRRPHPPWPGNDGNDGDDGGLAGVREPRRPKPAPPHLSAELEEARVPLP